jgi:pSer/pThr/pTyr-binding forkhead associated (FHA) protein/tetratricopeptide (TPR) repeat protein
MAKILMTDPSGREKEYEIGPEPQVFGRGEDSDVVLGSRSVIRHHLKMWDEDGKVMVEDLTGGKGTRLSGETVSGVFELTPGAQLEVGVFLFSIPGATLDTEVEGEVLEEAPPVPYLQGTKGPTKGVEVELEDGENDVGRDPGLYLVIDDPSISRLHARMTVRAGKTQLVDMRSSNGIFVNNKRVESAELKSGDVVRFGNMEFKYICGAVTSKGAAALKRRRLILMAAGGVVGLFFIIAIGAKSCGDKGTQESAAVVDTEDEIPLEVRVDQHLKSARAIIEKDDVDWKQAEREVQAALDLHPISADARRMKRKIKEEKANKTIYDDARVNYDLSKWSEALALMRKIPQDSVYFKKVKYKISDIEKKLGDYHMTEGKSYYTAQQYRKAYKHFLAYMALKPCDKRAYDKYLQPTEAKMRRFKHYGYKFKPYVFDCPEEKKAALAEAGKVDLDPEEIMRARYPQSDIYKAMMYYYRGKAQMAIQSVRRLKALSNTPEVVEQAKELERFLMIIDGKYNEGVSLLLRGELLDAQENFRIALDSDKKIVPPGIRSYYREEIGKQLAAKLYKEGLEEFTRKRLRKSFEHWSECLKINPDDTDCMRGLNELEKEAEGILSEAKILENRGDGRVFDLWEKVLTITRPESLSYKKAQLKLKEYE